MILCSGSTQFSLGKMRDQEAFSGPADKQVTTKICGLDDIEV